ncbi:MAG: Rrf2 family transcriptional regulator [Gemmatimonadetes bacterium]|nr:Rrf2 family transcriptional regulator [Gemmatimonadota bacterium]MXW06327.1 Rrf2 family transcriptional regulator [Gemmatimonadota bacterium]MYB61675.1 Rrf2 family transcriptional regulator [Gemmatimonadota bacterium]
MRVSAKAEYACRAVLELTRYHDKAEVIHISDIAVRQSIPEKYLVQILLQLQRAGLVRSKRGATGGYSLARTPGEISLGDVIRAMDGALISVESLSGDAEITDQLSGQHVLKDVWMGVQEKLGEIMDGITFEDISRQAQKSLSMYYI